MSNEATPLPVEILSAEHVTPPAILAKARKAAKKVQSITESAVRSYFELCECLREVPPHEARKILVEEGFNKVRSSEILRVSHTTPELFAEYKERAIGFKLALSKAREIAAGSQSSGGDSSNGKPDTDGAADGAQVAQSNQPQKTEEEQFAQQLAALVARYYPASGRLADWQRKAVEFIHGEYEYFFNAVPKVSAQHTKKQKNKKK